MEKKKQQRVNGDKFSVTNERLNQYFSLTALDILLVLCGLTCSDLQSCLALFISIW